jgi:hypothetical protein
MSKEEKTFIVKLRYIAGFAEFVRNGSGSCGGGE